MRRLRLSERVGQGTIAANRMRFKSAGMIQDLLMLPGLNCDARLWRDVVAGLGARARCLVADLRGPDSVAGMAAQALAGAPPRFALAGLSMGGYVAMEIMRLAPERVTRLALLDTSARADDAARTQARMTAIALVEQGKFGLVARTPQPGLLAPQHLGTALADDVADMAERAGARAYLGHQKAIMARIDSRPSLAAINVPTLVGVGEADGVTPPELAEEMARLIPGARLVVFPGCAHMSTMEAPDAVTAAMAEWLEAQGARH